MQPPRKWRRREDERRSRQGCQRLDRFEHRGKKTPTLVRLGREAVPHEVSVQRRSAEAVSGVVKRPVPRSSCREPKLDAAPTRCKSRKRTGNTRGAGARRSFGWQMLVGRITRLHRREVARPRGESRALSQKEARSTVRRGARVEKRRNGARRCTFPKVGASFGLQVSACRFADTTEGIPGLLPTLPLPAT